ncbi:MAG TPA: VWA domain-containing protein [Candidatus Dormibacteraeota bacterium]|jgi:uncharacterized protein with von Willebrand factor type A (vWA) domain
MSVLAKLQDLGARAGRWLGLTPPPAHTAAIAGDRFDTWAWRETFDQAAGLRELAEDLGERHDYARDLLADVFLAAYKAAPELRDRAEMDPSRLVNYQVVGAVLDTPEWAELRRETAGDAFASAMAVISQGSALRRMLEAAEEAQRAADAAAQARQEAAEAAGAVGAALDQAADQADGEGNVPEDQAAALEAAIDEAERAEQAAQDAAAAAARALAAAAPGIRSAARAAAAQAAEEAREEAALMRAWGIAPGELQRMSFDQRARLAQRLRGGRLGRFAQLIGRFRQMASAERARRIEHVPGELVGITLGDDLSRLIPSELASLGVPAMRAAFAARYAERRLMVYETRGDERAGQGAIVACVDCSGSMGRPGPGGVSGEAWAKACALALLDQAQAARRDFAALLFSSETELQVFRFPAGRRPAISDVLDLAEHFWGGGTDFARPLDAAAELLEAEHERDGRMRGDVVLITDGECEVTEEWMRAWNERKERLQHRVFGVAVRSTPGPVLDALSDNLRSITDLTGPDAIGAASDLFRVI